MPKLYVDLTTIAEEMGRHPHGTTRVERGLVEAFARMARADIAFCRYSRAAARFVPVEPARARAIARAPTQVEPRRDRPPVRQRHWLLAAGRRLEAAIRRGRDRLRQRAATFIAWLAPPIFEPGSVLLFLSELQRHDFALLMRLKRARGVALVFVFYDLLGVLPPGDPRLADPNAADLPGTDFIVREGALLLAISRYSAACLARHIETCGQAGPPVAVIRLAGRLCADPPAQARVPGLEANGFVLAVGDIGARKNQKLLISVWDRLVRSGASVPPLVLVGRLAEEAGALRQAIAAIPGLEPLVRVLTNASDPQLSWLYANCRFTVFPSLAEGFGLPVAESLAFGKVCVASAATAIPEASQGLAIHLDPADEPAWFATIARLIDDEGELRAREAEIRARYRQVGWEDTAADILAAIETLHARRTGA